MPLTKTVDRTKVRKIKLRLQGNDFAYWQSLHPEERIATLETIRNEYISWKHGAQQGFQRILRVTKRA